jgi:hypothetical protein
MSVAIVRCCSGMGDMVLPQAAEVPENHVHCSTGWLADIICLFAKHRKSKSLKRDGQQFHAHQWVLATSLMRERRIR